MHSSQLRWLLATLTAIVEVSSVPDGPQVIDATGNRYLPTWDSLDSRPLPAWYDVAKVGIFVHWGVYAVPAFGTEWFWTNWKTVADPAYVDFMRRNYPPGFTYQDFGGQLTGELFNATEWAALFAAAGAQYVVLTSKHHDGYAMWPSRYSFSWNAGDVGLHRDVIGELAAAVRQTDKLRFGLYHSLFEWFHPMYVSDRQSGFNDNEFVVKKILPELKELVQRYEPEVLWSDGEWEASDTYWRSKEFLAWLYNDSPVALSVVTNDRWGNTTLCKHGDFYTCTDRYNPGALQKHKWENAMTLDRHSWGHRVNAKLSDYLSAQELIAQLVVTISCGGNILINVGPNKAGTIEPIFEERLLEMGKWLQTNGEAVYASHPWILQNDTVTPGVWYTTAARAVFAIVLDYPYGVGGIALHAFGNVAEQSMRVTMLGYPIQLEFEALPGQLFVKLPPKENLDQHGLSYAWTLRIDMGK